MYITGRSRKLIQLLLEKEQPLRIKQLADVLEVSERTIHRDMKDLEPILEKYQLKLIKLPGVGLKIKGAQNAKANLKDGLLQSVSIDFTPEERQTMVLATLLEADEPVKLVTLSMELNVTMATISHDLDQLERPIEKNSLQLIRKPGYGITIEGKEANKRAALSNLIFNHVDDYSLLSLLRDDSEQPDKQILGVISERLLGLVDSETLQMIEKYVDHARAELPYELADSAYVGLIVHLALAIERLKKGETIQFDQEYLGQLTAYREYTIAKSIIRELAKELDMPIPDDEIGYITMHLIGAKLRVDQHQSLYDVQPDITYQIEQLVQYVGDRLHVSLNENESLLKDLTIHLQPTIYRIKQKMNIYNPLIDEIEQNYAHLFRLVQEAVRVVFPDLKFPNEEIGFVVLHFAAALMHHEKEMALSVLAVCSSGIGTAKILATQLKEKFREITHVTNISLFELQDMDVTPFHMIISTVPLENFHCDYILATPILRESEVHDIQKRIKELKLTPKKRVDQKLPMNDKFDLSFVERLEAMGQYSNAILAVLQSLQVDHPGQIGSVGKVLKIVCQNLVQQQVIQDADVIWELLMGREKVGGLGIPSTSMVLFHTRSALVERVSLTVSSIGAPVLVQGMDAEKMEVDTILLMLAPEKGSNEMLEVLSYFSSLLISGSSNAVILQSGDKEHIQHFLAQQLELFLKTKKLI